MIWGDEERRRNKLLPLTWTAASHHLVNNQNPERNPIKADDCIISAFELMSVMKPGGGSTMLWRRCAVCKISLRETCFQEPGQRFIPTQNTSKMWPRTDQGNVLEPRREHLNETMKESERFSREKTEKKKSRCAEPWEDVLKACEVYWFIE